MIDSATRSFVIQRAGYRCEYCHLPQHGYAARFNVDHIFATQHRQDDRLENLALSCPKCNRKKGPNLSGIDPISQTIVPLFHPRNDRWDAHFVWQGLYLASTTQAGRATIAALDLNGEDRIRLRRALATEGLLGT